MVAVTVREKTLNVSNFAKAKQFYANICKNFLKQFFCKQKPRFPSDIEGCLALHNSERAPMQYRYEIKQFEFKMAIQMFNETISLDDFDLKRL